MVFDPFISAILKFGRILCVFLFGKRNLRMINELVIFVSVNVNNDLVISHLFCSLFLFCILRNSFLMDQMN